MFLVVGGPGTGKTWLADKLSKHIGGIHVDNERIRYELFETSVYNKDESVVVDNMVDYMIEVTSKQRMYMVLDGCSNSVARRKQLAKIADDIGYEIVTIWVQANNELAKVRSSKAPTVGEGTYKRQLEGSLHSKISESFDAPKEKEGPIVISGNHSFKTQLSSILAGLVKRNVLSMPREQILGLRPDSSSKKTSSAKERRNHARFIA